MKNKARYKVAVKCCTYNQASYIKEALNGFVIQETDFPFVCCVIDDASTDGEQEVIKKYVAENFNLSEPNIAYVTETDDAHITFARHKNNKNCFFAVLYMKRNLYNDNQKKLDLISEWTENSEYIAVCEGDDYWNDKNKIQLQVAFLEANPKYGMCYTQCNYYYQNRGFLDTRPWGGTNEKFRQFMNSNTVPTLTAMWRTKLEIMYYIEVDPYSHGWMMGDYPRWIWLSHESLIKFLPYTTGIYRVLPSSASHSSDINVQIMFSKSSFDIRCFYEEFFNIPSGTYIKPDAFVKRKLYLYAINHKVKEYFTLLFNNPMMIFNVKIISYLRYFLMKPKTSDEV